MADFDVPTGDLKPRGSRSRRAFIRLSLGTTLAATFAGGAALLFDFLRPTRPETQGLHGVGRLSDFPRGGDPIQFTAEGKRGAGPHGFWVVHLDPGDSRIGGSGGGDGLLALYQRCPRDGCTVPWRPDFEYRTREGEDSGWFRCPCGGETFTKAGVHVYGPAPRSMDTFEVRIDGSGNVFVNTLRQTPGSPDNPTRAVKATTVNLQPGLG